MAATDQTTISNLTELTTPASTDVLAIDDVSAGETKHVTMSTLFTPAHGKIYNLSVDQGGSVIAVSASTTYANITGASSAGENENVTVDETTGTLTLPAQAGTYWVFYNAGVARASGGGTSDVYLHVTSDGTHVNGSETYISTDGSTNDAHAQSAAVLFSATGSEVLRMQLKIDSGTTTINIDNYNFGVIFVSY